MSNKNIKHSNSWVKTPTVFQMENAECGAACLGMILSYFGKHVSLEQLRVECGVSKDGCNALNIFKAGEMHDLEVKSFKYSIEDLKNQKEPCIIHWEFNHFVVFEGIKNDIALINDPAIGRRKISLKKLGESFTGVVLTFSPTSKFKKEKGNNEVVDFLLRRLSGQKNVLGLLIAVGLILVIIGVLTSSFSKIFIDNILVSKNVSIFWSFLLIAIFTICFSYLFSNIKNIVVNKFQLKLSLLFGHDLIRRTLKLPISFYEQRYAGDLSQRINNNDVANSFLSGRLTGIFLDVITAAFYLIFMLMFSFPLTLVSILGLGLSLLLSYKLIDVIKERIVKLNQDAGKLNGLLFSGIEIASTLKACGIEDRYVEKIVSHYSSMGGSEQKINRFNELINLFPSLIIQLTNISILIFGAYFVVQGDYTIGLLSAFGVMFGSFSAPVNSLFGLFQQLQNLKANLMRVNDIENYQIDDRFKNKNIPSDNVDSALKGKIEIKHLNFGYNKVSKPVIEDFNLEIEPGEVVAIVGPSGCGKSTILKLLGGLYQPWNGEILFDGKKAEDYSLNVLNASVSTINQDSVMFAASVKENLTFWNTNILDSDIVSASKDACIYDAVSLLPTGFNHKLSQGGKNLSGGQRQRLEIARALVNNPSILLMDEATSSLDPIVEKDIMHNIKKRGCTCVIVAHRLSTIRDADKILCIKNGRVVQSGTHNELKSKKGLYKDLIKNI